MTLVEMKYKILLLLLLFSILNKDVRFHSETLKKHNKSSSTLKIGVTHSFDVIDPFETSSTWSSQIMQLIYETLLNLEHDFTLSPSLAKSWEISQNEKIWIFNLHENVRFHDGSSLTTEDVFYTFEKWRENRKSIFSSVTNNIKEIKIISPTQIKFELYKTDVAFKNLITTIPIVSHDIQLSSPRSIKSVIGTGPFKLIYQTEKKAKLERNEHYDRIKIKIKKIVFKDLQNERKLLSSFLNEEIDLIFSFNLDYDLLLKNIPNIKSVNFSSPILFSAFFNQRLKKFKSPCIRQALNYAINKDALFESIRKNDHSSAVSVITPTSSSSTIKPYIYDPALAAKMIHSCHFDTSQPIDILIADGFKITEILVEILRRDLDFIGISIRPYYLSHTELIRKVFVEKNFQLALFPYSNIDGVFHDSLFWGEKSQSPYNFVGYNNESASRELLKARYSLDPKIREESYKEFSKIIHEDPPAIFLFWKSFSIIYHDKIKNLDARPHQLFKKLYDVWIKE